MIGRLRGRVDGRGDGWALIDVGGVGYMVEGSARLLDNLPSDGEAVSLAIETYVREDQLRLFGFASEEERSWFRLLMGVQGVGAKATSIPVTRADGCTGKHSAATTTMRQ